MNRQTLSYHTKLHEWYWQHTIQQDKQQQQQQQQQKQAQLQQSNTIVSGRNQSQLQQQQQQGINTISGRSQLKARETTTQSHLSNDKIYSIDQWCTDVNSSLFCIKKKESSPLYRKCRLSASTKSAMASRAADPRRVRSAEVFTRTGHWAKQPKPMVKGGELLPKHAGLSEKGSKVSSSRISERGSKVEFCVTNSKESGESKSFPRVNHDSLSVRSSQNKKGEKIVDKTVVLSPQFIPHSLKSNKVKISRDNTQGQKAKTVTVNYIVNSLVREKEEKENKELNQDPKQMQDQKNSEGSRKERIFSASQKSIKTNVQSSILDGENTEIILNHSVKFCDQDAIPTFCNTCSGIYSGNAPPPTPVTCGSCVHGINLGSNSVRQSSYGPSQAQIQKELAQKLVKTEKIYGKRITSANIELKMSENRLTEDSLHYSAEREMVRGSDTKPAFLMPSTFDDLQDERNLSFQDDKSNQSDKLSGANMSTDSPLPDKPCDTTMDKEENETQDDDGQKEEFSTKTQDALSSDDDEEEETINFDPSESFQRRNSRRVSLCFSTRPEVSNISKSNSLLRVLSIDDCKIAMRYNPHKVLEDHQMADSPRVELIQQAMGRFGSDLESMEEDSQVAMRLSQNSSVTTLQSSTANDATIANKLQYKILFGPEDLNRFKNIRPKSPYLTKAFQTMINDRTIMQRMDGAGHPDRVKTTSTLTKTIEGPKYRIINTALKREMGNMLLAQRQKLLTRYERQKSGGKSTKYQTPDSPSLQSLSNSKSLSLESLPSVKKGVLNDTE